MHHIRPPIMWKFFRFKRNRYRLRGNYLLKLLDRNTCLYGTQALSFKGSLLWKKIPKKCKNLNSLEGLRVKSNNGILPPVVQ